MYMSDPYTTISMIVSMAITLGMIVLAFFFVRGIWKMAKAQEAMTFIVRDIAESLRTKAQNTDSSGE
ncbi:MAG: hypothetical protein ACM3MK_06005 [Chitinophagales bacterium]